MIAVQGGPDAAQLAELVPLARRVAALDPAGLVRIVVAESAATAFARLPFDVQVSRTVRLDTRAVGRRDAVIRAADLVAWVESDGPAPQPRDAAWRGSTPPATGWRRLDTVPDTVLRPLVRAGALTLKEAATRDGVPGAQPRAEVADALLDSVVLTVTPGPDDPTARAAPVTLRALSALTRMGFLERGGVAHVDVAGRWIRVVARYGTVYLERPGQSLTVR